MPVRKVSCGVRGNIRLSSLSLAISPSPGKSLRSFNRLAGLFPRSIIAANRVALRMRSGKLVKLPLASASLTASMSRRGGRRTADNRLKPGLGVLAGEGPGCNPLAALYAPSIALAVGSDGFVVYNGAGSSVVIARATCGTLSSEDDLSINPVPLARGEAGFPTIGQTVSLCPSLVLEATIPVAIPAPGSTPILSNFDFCCGTGAGRT